MATTDRQAKELAAEARRISAERKRQEAALRKEAARDARALKKRFS